VATASLATSEIAWPIRQLLRKRPEVTTLMGTVTGVDVAARRVQLDGGDTLPYDTLVLATGARHAYFGHDEWSRSRPAENAGRRHHHPAPILMAFERAERETDPQRRAAAADIRDRRRRRPGSNLPAPSRSSRMSRMPADFRNIDPARRG